MNTPLPNQALDQHWQQWLDWATEQGLSPPRDARFETARAQVWEASEFVALSAARSPETLAALIADGALEEAPSIASLSEELAAALAEVADEAALQRALRLFRRRQMMRIIWRDLSGWAELDETLESLSALADCCIIQSLALLRDWTQAELGVPQDEAGNPQSLVVLGMGKLGAHELNLSSDIDLIFAFPNSGEVVGGPRPLRNEQFFTRLCQRLVQSLNTQTVDGFVFRVDTRLRPFGDAGPLAMSFDAMEGYYHSQAREWERYAMTKARVVAGEPGDADELMSMLRPFVYRRYLDFGAIESLRSLKVMIDRELRRKGMADNVKLGPGGIREIEFIGQSFQLIRGGRDPELQIRPIQPVLRLLAERGQLSQASTQALIKAYRFLRLVENRIQAWQDRQTHLLPERPEGQLRLARSMDFEDWASFKQVLDAHRQRVQSEFDQIFADPDAVDANAQVDADAQGGEDQDLEAKLRALWVRSGDLEQSSAVFAKAGFENPEGAAERLAHFRDALSRRGLSTRGGERLDAVMPRVLALLADSEHRDRALAGVCEVLTAVSGRTAYIAMLAEHPHALQQLVLLCAKSPWFAKRTARHPLLLDELIDPRRLFAPLHREGLEQELDLLLAAVDPEDQEERMERLRQFAQSNQLRVAAADVTEHIPLMVVSDYLTEIAEVATRRCLALAWEDLTARHGCPEGTSLAQTGFLIIGYGKLGGFELGYHSDLDLVFLYDDQLGGGATDGRQSIRNEQFYVRLTQRMIHLMTTPTYSGVLYEIDTRLRPDGNQGMIARSLASFAGYQADQAWIWEHQALVRARPVGGDERLFDRFVEIRGETLTRSRDAAELQQAVRDMRQKMRHNLDKTGKGLFDLKQGRGGIADIEFMVQFAVLRWAAEHPELTAWTDNIRLLETLERLHLLPGETAADLTRAYKQLRAAYHRNALEETPGLVPEDRLIEERERVIALWDTLMLK